MTLKIGKKNRLIRPPTQKVQNPTTTPRVISLQSLLAGRLSRWNYHSLLTLNKTHFLLQLRYLILIGRKCLLLCSNFALNRVVIRILWLPLLPHKTLPTMGRAKIKTIRRTGDLDRKKILESFNWWRNMVLIGRQLLI